VCVCVCARARLSAVFRGKQHRNQMMNNRKKGDLENPIKHDRKKKRPKRRRKKRPRESWREIPDLNPACLCPRPACHVLRPAPAWVCGARGAVCASACARSLALALALAFRCSGDTYKKKMKKQLGMKENMYVHMCARAVPHAVHATHTHTHTNTHTHTSVSRLRHRARPQKQKKQKSTVRPLPCASS